MRLSRNGGKLALLRQEGVDIVYIGTGPFREVIRARGHYLGGDRSPDDRFLFTTWGYHDRPTELLKIPVEGGSPTKTALSANYSGLRLSPDGRTVAMTRWSEHYQVWADESRVAALEGYNRPRNA